MSSSGKESEPCYRGNRGRFKKALDALEQFESIEKVQHALRKVKKGDKIASTQKSRQRFKNAHRNLKTPKDYFDEYD